MLFSQEPVCGLDFRVQRAFFIGCGLWLDDKLIKTSELKRHLSIPWSLSFTYSYNCTPFSTGRMQEILLGANY